MTESDAIDYLISRGEQHGLTLNQVLDMVPDSISHDMVMSAELVENKHISHIMAQSTHPELAQEPSNMILEDPTPNMERGADPISPVEEFTALIDNQLDAMSVMFA